METWDVLRNIWFILIGILFAGYSILDGFDLGIGSLAPFLAKRKNEKQALYQAIGPFWDGNEVWLLTGGGALFAAFPHAYATVFSGFYLALMVVLFSLIFRAVSLEFQVHDPARRRFWESAFVVGSFLPSLLYGVALGNVILGVPLDSNMDFTGSFFTLLRPLPLVFGLLGLAAILMQGAAWASYKMREEPQARARKIGITLVIPYGMLFVLAFVLTAVYLPHAVKRPVASVFTLVFAAGLFFLSRSQKKVRDLFAFVMSSLCFVSLWGIAGAVQFPNLVRASYDEALSVTINNASSSVLTLKVMLFIALIGMPLVIGYTIYLYKVFQRKVPLNHEGS